MFDEVDALAVELAGKDKGGRMDAVAEDLASRAHRFALLEVRTLAELLGLDPDDNADWSRGTYVRRVRLEDLDLDQPCAEHIKFLEGAVSAVRYAGLEVKAAAALTRGGADLQLREKERRLLADKMTLDGNPAPDLVYISTVLETRSGESLEFKGLVGDDGEVYPFYGPYELERGERIDLTDYVRIE